MRGIATLLIITAATVSLSAQEVRRLRLDVGYGVAPSLGNYDHGLRGISGILFAETSIGEFGLQYTRRSTVVSVHDPSVVDAMVTSTVALQIGTSARGPHTQFTIAGGVGVCHAEISSWSYDWTSGYPTYAPKSSTVNRFAAAADMRMCWNLFDHVGIGAAVFGAYVKDLSYIGFHLFLRAAV